MTLIIAVKVPTKRFNPKRRPLRFEPGIAVAVDTRFSWVKGSKLLKRRDDGQKWWQLGEASFAAFCGDIELGESAILFSRASCEANGRLEDQAYAVAALRTYTHYFSVTASRKFEATTVVYGARLSPNKFRLCTLSSSNGFAPVERDGLLLEGAGAGFAESRIDSEIESFTKGAAQPFYSGFKLSAAGSQIGVEPRTADDLIDVQLLSVAGILVGVADDAIQDARLVTVGGRTLAATLCNEGVSLCAAFTKKDSGWRTATAEGNHVSLQEVNGKKLVGPLLDERGQVSANLVELWTKPGTP